MQFAQQQQLSAQQLEMMGQESRSSGRHMCVMFLEVRRVHSSNLHGPNAPKLIPLGHKPMVPKPESWVVLLEVAGSAELAALLPQICVTHFVCVNVFVCLIMLDLRSQITAASHGCRLNCLPSTGACMHTQCGSLCDDAGRMIARGLA